MRLEELQKEDRQTDRSRWRKGRQGRKRKPEQDELVFFVLDVQARRGKEQKAGLYHLNYLREKQRGDFLPHVNILTHQINIKCKLNALNIHHE